MPQFRESGQSAIQTQISEFLASLAEIGRLDSQFLIVSNNNFQNVVKCVVREKRNNQTKNNVKFSNAASALEFQGDSGHRQDRKHAIDGERSALRR